MPTNEENGWYESLKRIGLSPVQQGLHMAERLDRIMSIPERADAIADQRFPGSARDASTMNAFRHALGTGMMTQELGGGLLGELNAKNIGYLWEALGAGQYMDSEQYRNDTRHDLNANALGARTARNTRNNEELIQALEKMAKESRVESPPGVFESSPGYMTRSVR